MILLPAIDLYEGKVVRLTRGDYSRMTVYREDPLDQAREFEAAGAAWLHTVDLEGARDGATPNFRVVAELCRSTGLQVEVGGGIRTLEHIDRLLSRGVHQVILGSVAVKNPALVKEACAKYPGRIVAGIDAKAGIVAVEGWEASGHMRAEDLAKAMADAGVSRIIFTDIARDGMLTGVNVEATVQIAKASGLPVTASGGVGSLEDLRELKKREAAGIEGCIIGKALYTGAIDLRQAVAIAKEA